jgi:hypothetical protein
MSFLPYPPHHKLEKGSWVYTSNCRGTQNGNSGVQWCDVILDISGGGRETMRSKGGVLEPIHEDRAFSLRYVISIGMAATLVMMFGGRAYGDLILSDTLTVNIKAVNSGNPQNPDTLTMTIPEVTNLGESKIAIDLSSASGFIGKDGYILFCEPPLNPLGGCGPNNAFKGVSDILVKGVQTANMNKPAYFFFSDSDSGTFDAAATLMALFKVTDIKKLPNPLGPIGGVAETGAAQEVGDLFGFTDKKALIVQSRAA